MNINNASQPNTSAIDETSQNDNIPEPETAPESEKEQPQTEPVQMLNRVASGVGSFFKNNQAYMVPASIVLAGLLISGAVVFGDRINDIGQVANNNAPNQVANVGQVAPTSDNVKKISAQDHIRGNKNAPVKIIEFSDLQCPFCQKFHNTVLQAMIEFDDELAWVYRHFPLESIHPRARPQAIASECINELGGNDAFWKFIDAVFQTSQANSDAQLSQMAVNLGINRSQFESCLQSGKYDTLVSSQTADAQASGARGTPYSVIIAPNGKTFVVNGAQPYASLKATIEQALQAK